MDEGEATGKWRLPVTVTMLNRMRAQLDLTRYDDALFFAICSMATYGLFRLGELLGDPAASESGNRWRHISAEGAVTLVMHLEQSKTAPFRWGCL